MQDLANEWTSAATVVSTFWLILTTLFVVWQIKTKRFMRESIALPNETLQDERCRIDRNALFGPTEYLAQKWTALDAD